MPYRFVVLLGKTPTEQWSCLEILSTKRISGKIMKENATHWHCALTTHFSEQWNLSSFTRSYKSKNSSHNSAPLFPTTSNSYKPKTASNPTHPSRHHPQNPEPSMRYKFTPIYLHHFTCGHSESHHGIVANEKDTLHMDYPCVRCEPNTPKGQERLKTMWNWSYSIPYVSEKGDIVLGPRRSKYHPLILIFSEKGDRYEVKEVRQDSAEGLGYQSLYGYGGRDF